MTNKEALIAVLAFTPDEGTLAKALLDSGLEPDSDYVAANKDGVEKSEMELLFSAIQVSSEKEGSWSVTYSREGLMQRLLYLARKHGREDIVDSITGTPIVTNISNLW